MPSRFIRSFALALLAVISAPALAQKTINIPADYPTIQAGINAANTGDTVLVAPGTYYENLTLSRKEITLTSSGGASKTILDGMSKGPILSIDNTPSLKTTISGFTIRNGYGGTYMAAIYLLLAGATIENNAFINNGYAVYDLFGAITFRGNTVDATMSVACNYNGGVLLSPLNGIVDANGNPASVLIDSNTFLGSNIACSGDGVQSNGSNIPIFISNNRISGFAAGVGTFPNSNLFVVRQNLITNNRQYGIIIDHGYNIPEADPADTFIVNNTLVNNVTAPLNSDLKSLFGADAEITIGDAYSKVAVLNNIISGHSATNPVLSCAGLVPKPGDQLTPIIFDSNIVWNPGGPLINGGCPSQVGSFGNLNVDPAFLNTATADFHLRATSPAVDSGNNSAPFLLPTDLDGNTRILDATGHGSPIIDRGAYELVGVNYAATTTLTLSATSYYIKPGTGTTLTATLASTNGVPAGLITFLQDGVFLATVKADSKGSATIPISLAVPGSHVFEASYAGQGVFPAASAVEIYILVEKYQPVIRFTASPNPALVNQPVTFTATITSPDGAILSPIIFGIYPTPTDATMPTDASGKAVFIKAFTYPVNLTYEADSPADSAHYEAIATLPLSIINGYATSTTLASSPNPSVSGQTVTFSAAVTSTNGTPTGSIQFSDGATVLGTQTLSPSGTATFSTNALTVGTHTITATYLPTGTFAGSSAALSQTVQSGYPTTTVVSSSLFPSTVGQSVTFTAHVSSANGVPTGFFAITDSASNIGALVPVDVSGNGLWTPATLARGLHTISATYNPDPGFATSTGTFLQQVDGLADTVLLAATPTTATFGSSIALTATVTASGTPTGSVTFLSNAVILGSAPLVNGIATLFSTTLPLGTNSIRAVYSGDATYNIASSNSVTVTLTIQPTTIALRSSANPSPALVPVTFTAQLFANTGPATIVGQPIVFTIDGVIAGTATTTSQGLATFTTSALTPGTHTVTASFAGDLTHGASTPATLTEQVVPNATVTTVLPPLGTITQLDRVSPLAIVRSNYLSAVPTGSVTIFEGTTALGTLGLTPTNGPSSTASILLNPLAPGTHVLVAVYTPDTASLLPSQSAPFTLVIVPASFTLTLSEPTLTLQTGHHHTETVSLTSIGGLAGTFNLTCGPTLPLYTTCTWAQTSVVLPASGTVSTSLTIDTDQLIGFLAKSNPAATPGAPLVARSLRHGWAATSLAALIPFTLLGFRRRHKLRPLLSLLLLAALASTLTACGANKYPFSTAPGTYTIPVTATGPPVPGGVSPTQTVNLTLVVTP